jgi:putative methionine-R-sulfoxide reductase with GAF domain
MTMKNFLHFPDNMSQQLRGSTLQLTRKLLIPTLIVFSLIMAGLITYNAITSARQFDAVEEARLENMSEVFNARLKAKEDLAVALATDVANNPEVQAAFAAHDRERLIELTLPSYQVLDAQFDVPQFQFHLPPATSFLRLHSLEKYGDDLSSFRFTVLAANAENRTVGGPELGRAGLGVRGVVPVSYQGRHIGTVEFGTDIGSTLIEELKNDFGYDIQILLSRVPAEVATFSGVSEDSQGPIDELLFQASTLDTPVFAPTTSYTQALAGSAKVEHVSLDKRDYAVYSMPLYDYSGNVIGVIDIISDHTVIAQQQNSQVILSAVVLLAILVASGFGFAYIAGRTLRPIGELTSAASAIAAGDFSKRTNVKSDDELGTLAQSFNSMTEQLQDLFGTLEQRVAARTKDLEIVAEVGTAAATIQESKRLLQEVVDLTKERFNLYHSHIYLLDEEARLLVLTAGAGEPGRIMVAEGRSIPLDREQSLVARAARERKGVTVNDVTQAPDHLPNPLLPDTRSELAVPMIVGGNVIGVFDIQSDQVGRFTESDVNIQTTLAAQLAVSIQNVRSFEQSKKQAELQSLVNMIGSRIQRTTSIEETLQTAIRELGTAIGASRVKAKIQPDSKAVSTEPTAAD